MSRLSTSLTAAALAAVAAAGLLGGALSRGAAPRVGGCQPGQAALSHIRGSDGAGQTGYRLTVKNVGTAPCYFNNHPEVTLLGRRGKALPTHVHWQGKLKNITIGPGKTVRSRFRFSPDVPGRGEQHRGRCEPVAHRVRLVLRLDLKTLGRAVALTGPVRPPTSVCEHGGISASSLR